MPFVNPMANPLFMQIMVVVGGMLAIALVYTLFVEREHLSELHKRPLFHRCLSSTILAPLCVVALFSGPIALTVLVTVMALIGTLEYGKVTRLSAVFLPITIIFSLDVPIVTAVMTQPAVQSLLEAFLMIGATAVFCYGRIPNTAGNTGAITSKSAFPNNIAVSQSKTTGAIETIDSSTLPQAAMAFLSIAYTPFLGSYAILISKLAHGSSLLLALIAAIGLSDTLAYVCGKTFGYLTPKLAPHVSPNKTWAGVIGSLIGAYLGFLIVPFAYPESFPALNTAGMTLLPVAIAVAGIIGDLFESVIKRSFAVKDAGNWLPGFGGLLDRVDGLLFALPVCYYIVLACI